MLKLFPAVCIIGPRQCGKKTLVKTFSTQYYDLETEEVKNRLLFQLDLLATRNELIILDEAQECPTIILKLLSQI